MYKKGDKVRYIGDIHWNNSFYKDYRKFKGCFEVIDTSFHHRDVHVFIKSVYNEERTESKNRRGLDISGRYWCMNPLDFEIVEIYDKFNEELDELFEL